MKSSISAVFSPVSRMWVKSLLLVSCVCAAASSPSAFADNAYVDLTPSADSTGASVLDFLYSTGGWSPEPGDCPASGCLVDYSSQLQTVLYAQRQTNVILMQLLFLAVCWSVAAVSLVTFKGLNHFLGYHGAAKKS